MTRTEFEENVVSFGDLVDFCYDNNLEVMEDVISDDQLDDDVNEDLQYHNGSWQDLRDRLDEIPQGYDWYRRDGFLDFCPLDDYDFERYREDVIRAAEDEGVFEDEEEEEEQDAVDPEAIDVATAQAYEAAEEERRRHIEGYYFTDPLTGEVLVAGYDIARVNVEALFG